MSELQPNKNQNDNKSSKEKGWNWRIGAMWSAAIGVALTFSADTNQLSSKHYQVGTNPQAKLENTIKEFSQDAKLAALQTKLEAQKQINELLIQSEASLNTLLTELNPNLNTDNVREGFEGYLDNIAKLITWAAGFVTLLKIYYSITVVNSVNEKSNRTTYEVIGNLSDSLYWLAHDLKRLTTDVDKTAAYLNIVNHGIDILQSGAILCKVMMMKSGKNSEDMELMEVEEILKILVNKILEKTGASKAVQVEKQPIGGEPQEANGLEAIQEVTESIANATTREGGLMLKLFQSLLPQSGQDWFDLSILSVYALVCYTMGSGAILLASTVKDAYNTYKTMLAEGRQPLKTLWDDFASITFWSTQKDASYQGYGVAQLLAYELVYLMRMKREKWDTKLDEKDVERLKQFKNQVINGLKNLGIDAGDEARTSD